MENTTLLAALNQSAGYGQELDMPALEDIAEKLRMPLAQVAAAASFYTRFQSGKMGMVADGTVRDPVSGEQRRLLSQKRNYQGLRFALEHPETMLKEVKESGLLGRGGAAFPTGAKWEMTANISSDRKYVIANADEGEPDTAKDGVILCRIPYAVLEGMVICARCVGADKGYIYIRGEYPEAIQTMKKEISNAYAEHFLGSYILGTDFRFDVEIIEGAGSYVCGEETALLDSIEGKQGQPRLKPPYPGASGLFGAPTVINNVETLANIPWIIEHGASDYRSLGTESEPGTKLVTISGEVEKPGVYEFPFGTNIEEILTGAGMRFPVKAIQIGGGATGKMTDTAILSHSLDEAGCAAAGVSLGTGSLRVISPRTDLAAYCLNVMQFFLSESCGQCTPCRFGLERIVELLQRILAGAEEENALEEIQAWCSYIEDSAKCAFGRSSTGMLRSVMNRFGLVHQSSGGKYI